MFGNQTAGVDVTKYTSLGLSAVWACNAAIADPLAAFPFELKRTADGKTETVKDHYLNDLISTSPSKLYTSFTFRQTLQTHLNLDGNAYAKIHRSRTGNISQLEILQPYNVTPYLLDGELWYRIHNEGVYVEDLSHKDIIHIPGLSFDGLKGKNPIEVHRESIGLGLATQRFGNKFYENGAHVSGGLEIPGKLKPEQLDRLENSFNSKYGGVNQTGKTIMLEAGMKYQPIGIKPADASFIETRKFTTNEIAMIFKVPPHLIGALEKATNNNVEQLNINFVMYNLYPICKKWEQEFNRKLLTPRDREQGYFVRFNLNSLMRGDSRARANFYQLLYNIRAINPNEIRELENMNPYEGGEKFGQPMASNSKENIDNENQNE